MIIGFDAKRANANFTGLGNYSRFMVDTMATYGDEHKYRMYIPKQCKNASYDSLLKHKNVSSILPRSSVMKRFRALWRTFFIKRGLLQDGVQLYHGLSNELPVGIHRTGIRSVVTIHDLIFLRYPLPKCATIYVLIHEPYQIEAFQLVLNQLPMQLYKLFFHLF